MKLESPIQSLVDLSDYWFSRLRPRKVNRSEETSALLSQMYPSVNWDRVQFYQSLPWFLNSRFTWAIVLPAFFSFNRINVYFSEYDELSVRGKGTIIHEAYHVQQYSERASAWGFGFFRVFLFYYLGAFFQLALQGLIKGYPLRQVHLMAYQQHPMEKTAYTHEELCTAYLNGFGIQSLYEKIPQNLIIQNSGHRFSTPFVFVMLAACTTLFLSVFRLLGDVFLSVYCLFLRLSILVSGLIHRYSVSK